MQIAPATVVRSWLLHVAVAAAAALASTGCSASQDEDEPGPRGDRGTAAAGPGDDGRFDARERATVEKAVAAYDASLARLSTGADACNREALELSEAGRPPADQVRCHVTTTRSLVRDVGRIRAAVGALDAGYRPECERARRSLAAFVASYEAAWQRVLDDWLAYSTGDRSHDDDVVPDTERASRLASELTDDRLAALGTECFSDDARDER